MNDAEVAAKIHDISWAAWNQGAYHNGTTDQARAIIHRAAQRIHTDGGPQYASERGHKFEWMPMRGLAGYTAEEYLDKINYLCFLEIRLTKEMERGQDRARTPGYSWEKEPYYPAVLDTLRNNVRRFVRETIESLIEYESLTRQIEYALGDAYEQEVQ